MSRIMFVIVFDIIFFLYYFFPPTTGLKTQNNIALVVCVHPASETDELSVLYAELNNTC